MAEWIGVDLDGTLAKYTDWQEDGGIGEPIQPMIDRVKDWLKNGQEVRIMTARANANVIHPEEKLSGEEFVRYQITIIEEWCKKHIGTTLPITCEKDYQMLELWDDRCRQVKFNTGETYEV